MHSKLVTEMQKEERWGMSAISKNMFSKNSGKRSITFKIYRYIPLKLSSCVNVSNAMAQHVYMPAVQCSVS